MTMYDHPLDVPQAAAPEFRIWIDLEAQPPSIGVSGEIDLATCAPLRKALDVACERADDAVTLDFRLVSFIGSTGIREIARALERVRRIEIHCLTPAVRRVLEMISLGPRVTILSDA